MPDINFEEFIHYDKRMERGVLGQCIMEPNAFGQISGLLNEDCFYVDANRLVFKALHKLWLDNERVDAYSLNSYMARNRIKIPDGSQIVSVITQLTDSVVSSANIENHSLILRQLYCERELEKLKYQPRDRGGDVLDKIKRLQEQLKKLTEIRVSYDWKDMTAGVMELMQHMEKVKDRELIGVPTGFEEIDLITGGLVPGSYIIGGRPSAGKTAFANGLALYQANNGHTVGIVSLEMPMLQQTARFASLSSGFPFYKIYRNKMDSEVHSRQLHGALAALSQLPLFISDKTGVDIYAIKSKAAQLIYRHKCHILYIDYVQLVDVDDTNRHTNREQQVAKISRACKLMSMEFGIPVVLLCQLSRDTYKNQGQKPQLHNLRESGSLEQDADGVIFVHRDWKVGIEQDENGRTTEDRADAIIAKWRNGETDEIKIGWDGPRMRFFDLKKHPVASTLPPPGPVPSGWKPYLND